MNLDSAPRLNKWMFLAIDAVLLLVAFIVVYFADNPYAPLPFVSAVLLVALAAIIGLVPFLTEYAAESAEYVSAERARVAEQAQRLQAAADSLARAAAQIKAVEEAVQKSARDAETLPYRMQEKLAEFNEALSAREESDREALETELEELRATNSDRLKSVAEKIQQATGEWTALEGATRQQLSSAQAALAKLQSGIAEAASGFDSKTDAALQRFDSKVAAALEKLSQVSVAAMVAPVAPAPTPVTPTPEPPPAPSSNTHAPFYAPPVPPTPSTTVDTAAPFHSSATHPAPEPAIVTEISMTDAPAQPEVSEAPKPRKPRAPRKPKADEILAAMSADSSTAVAVEEPVAEPVSAADPVPVAEPASDTSPRNGTESSTSSDGATRLLATAYIGIGNKLFIRGDGPGLSWDAGVPMQFVSIGKWGWSTQDSVNPIRCRLYKNDDLASLTGELVLEPGRHTEVTALF